MYLQLVPLVWAGLLSVLRLPTRATRCRPERPRSALITRVYARVIRVTERELEKLATCLTLGRLVSTSVHHDKLQLLLATSTKQRVYSYPVPFATCTSSRAARARPAQPMTKSPAPPSTAANQAPITGTSTQGIFLKVINPNNKKDWQDYTLRGISRDTMDTPTKMRQTIVDQCGEDIVPEEIGYFVQATKHWIQRMRRATGST